MSDIFWTNIVASDKKYYILRHKQLWGFLLDSFETPVYIKNAHSCQQTFKTSSICSFCLYSTLQGQQNFWTI